MSIEYPTAVLPSCDVTSTVTGFFPMRMCLLALLGSEDPTVADELPQEMMLSSSTYPGPVTMMWAPPGPKG